MNIHTQSLLITYIADAYLHGINPIIIFTQLYPNSSLIDLTITCRYEQTLEQDSTITTMTIFKTIRYESNNTNLQHIAHLFNLPCNYQITYKYEDNKDTIYNPPIHLFTFQNNMKTT